MKHVAADEVFDISPDMAMPMGIWEVRGISPADIEVELRVTVESAKISPSKKMIIS
jgi:hypothetical protein